MQKDVINQNENCENCENCDYYDCDACERGSTVKTAIEIVALVSVLVFMIAHNGMALGFIDPSAIMKATALISAVFASFSLIITIPSNLVYHFKYSEDLCSIKLLAYIAIDVVALLVLLSYLINTLASFLY